jgi:hypothetical protein
MPKKCQQDACNTRANYNYEGQKEWNNRLQVLQETIAYWLQPNNKTNRYIQVVQLYYDI